MLRQFLALGLCPEWLGCPNRDSSIGTIEPQSLDPKIKSGRSTKFVIVDSLRHLPQPFGDALVDKPLVDFAVRVLTSGFQRFRHGIDLRQLSRQLSLDARKFSPPSKIVMFAGVRTMVVEFFATVTVADVAKVLASDSMIIVVPSRDRRVETSRFGILQLGNQAGSFEALDLRQVA